MIEFKIKLPHNDGMKEQDRLDFFDFLDELIGKDLKDLLNGKVIKQMRPLKIVMERTMERITMKKIKIDGIPGWYYVEEDTLIYSCGDYADDVQVSDLTELKVWQYNELVNQLLVHYPDYDIDKLEGKFI